MNSAFHRISSYFYNSRFSLTGKLQEEYHRLSLWYFPAFMVGIVFYFKQDKEPGFWTYSIIISMILVFFLLKKRNIILRFALGLSLGFFFGIAVGKIKTASLIVHSLNKSMFSEVEGEVANVKPSASGKQIILENVTIRKKRIEIPKIRLSFKGEASEGVEVGDRIRVRARLIPIRSSILPETYNFGLYAAFDGIASGGYATSKPVILSKAEKTTVGKFISDLRMRLYARLLEVGGRDVGNFIAAMLLGETKGMRREISQSMRNAGISHILCVSGLHLSLVASIVFITSRFLLNLFDFIAFRYNVKLLAAILSLAGSYFYLRLSGSQIAATRAFIMTAIFILSVMLGRSSFPLRSVFIAAVFILSLNPEYLFHPSFQLSFIAVFSLISGYEFYVKTDKPKGKTVGIFYSVKSYFYSNVYSGFLAGIVTAPVVINQFYIFSSYSLLTNLVAVPVASFVLMPSALLFLIVVPIGLDYWIVKFMGLFTELLTYMVVKAESLPYYVIYFGNITPVSLLVFLFGFCWLSLWFRRWRFFGILIMVPGVILMFFSPKPELIFDPEKESLILENKEGFCAIYSNKKVQSFYEQYAANWLGRPRLDVLLLDKRFFELKSGRTLSLNYEDSPCVSADIQINMGKSSCKGNIIEVDRDFLRKVGTIMVFCSGKDCSLKYEDNSRFYGKSNLRD